MKCPAVLRCSGNKDPSGRKHNTGLSSKIFFGAGGRLEGWVGKGLAERDLLQSFSGLGKQRPIRPPMDIYQFH